MIKAVFFDLYHTLIGFEPPREETESRALKELGIEMAPESLARPLAIADVFLHLEIARLPLSRRSEPEKIALYARHQALFLKEAGIKAPEQLALEVLGKTRQVKARLVLFSDVLPALIVLRDRGLVLGLISNVDRDISPLLNELGAAPLLRVVVTSQECGFNKPAPEIFLVALAQAGVKAAEAMFVGDQYQIDVVGARGAGMRGILLDRGDYFTRITDCPRIRSLAQVIEHLEE